MENIFIALSNFPIIYPISVAVKNSDWITTGSTILVGFFSFLSHLVENHKHSMRGLGASKLVSHYLNILDIIACFITGSRYLYITLKKYEMSFPKMLSKNFLLVCCYFLAFVIGRASEYDKYNPALKNFYIVTHSVWHILIFTLMGKTLDVIYQK